MNRITCNKNDTAIWLPLAETVHDEQIKTTIIKLPSLWTYDKILNMWCQSSCSIQSCKVTVQQVHYLKPSSKEVQTKFKVSLTDGETRTRTSFIKKNPTRCNNVSKFYYSTFIWSSTCFGRHTGHHQEPKTALAASGFSYLEGCWTCSWWTLSGTVCLTTSNQLHVQQPST